MKDLLNLSLRLALICAVAALALAKVNDLTAGPIAEAELRAELEAVEAVLPPYAELRADTLGTDDGDALYYVGLTDGEPVGVAFGSISNKGYSGEVAILVGVDAAGKVNGVRVLRHAETPGLGANYTDVALLDAFYKGYGLDDRDWRVKKDGGDVDAVTGATVTGRAIAGAVDQGLRRFARDRDRLLSAPASAAEETQP